MKRPFESELEQQVHQLLRQLPSRQAPHSLAPRVRMALQNRKPAAWYQQPYWAWPTSRQIAALFLVILTTAGALYLLGQGNPLFITPPAWWTHISAVVASIGRGIMSLGHAISLVIDTFLEPWLWVALTICLLMYVSCVGAAAVFLRFACRRC